MLQYYKEFWMNYVNFSGRARRSAYWYVVLMNVILGVVFMFVTAAVPGLEFLSSIYALAAFLPGISLCVRRLHDIGRNGAWLLLVLVPLVGSILLIIWYCQDSEPGTNAYGPNPKSTV